MKMNDEGFEDDDDCKVILMKMNDEDDDDDDSTQSNYRHVVPNTVIKSFPINGRPCNSSADRFRLTQFDINLTQSTRLNPTLYSIHPRPSSRPSQSRSCFFREEVRSMG